MKKEVQKHIQDTINNEFKKQEDYIKTMNILQKPSEDRTRDDKEYLINIFGKIRFFKGKEELLLQLTTVMKFQSFG